MGKFMRKEGIGAGMEISNSNSHSHSQGGGGVRGRSRRSVGAKRKYCPEDDLKLECWCTGGGRQLAPRLSCSPAVSSNINCWCNRQSSMRSRRVDLEEINPPPYPYIQSSSSKTRPCDNNNNMDESSGNVSSSSELNSMPTASEIEEFFSSVEKQQKKQFAEKYNFDFQKQIPLEGRYEWTRVNP